MDLLPYEEALQIITDHPFIPEQTTVSLQQAYHHLLDEPLAADRDFPPFDRVTMDGIAISYASFQKGQRSFPIESTIAAGTPRYTLQHQENCVEIMTGAMMPENADTVIRYEDLSIESGVATISVDEIQARQNIHFQGIDRKKGDVIVPKGQRIGSPEINIAATLGKSRLNVLVPPRALLVSTGDELVEIDQQPEAYQIRKSNVFGIQAILASWGVSSTLLHLPDDEHTILEKLKPALNDHQMLVLTGGVSKGKFDYLPGVLDQIGVKKLFHRVQQRPGKPFWFGVTPEGATVFALPGNPVSSFMCTQVYIRHWLCTSLGIPQRTQFAKLANPVNFKPDLTYFLECHTWFDAAGTLWADPVFGNGSGDFANLVDGDGFIVIPTGKNQFEKGEVFPFISYRDAL